MATLCTRCGKVLPRGDARFCNNCGASLPIRRGESFSLSPGVGVPAVEQASGDSSQSQPRSSSSASAIRPPNDEKTSPSGSRPAIREQIAYQPPSRLSRRPANDEPPAWMNQLERGVYSTKPPAKVGTDDEAVSTNSRSTIPDFTRSYKKEVLPGEGDGTKGSEQAGFPSPEVVHPVRATGGPAHRELRVKVWQPQEESDDRPMLEREAGSYSVGTNQAQRGRQELSSQSAGHDEVEDLPTARLAAEHVPGKTMASPPLPAHNGQGLAEENRSDDLPTGPLVANSPGLSRPPSRVPARGTGDPVSDRGISSVPGMSTRNAPSSPGVPARGASSSPGGATPTRMPSHLDEIEQLETRPMVSQGRAAAQPLSPTTGASFEQRKRTAREVVQPIQHPVLQKPVSPLPFSQPEIQPGREVRTQRNTPPPSVAVAPRMARSRRKSRKPLVFMLILLGLLLAGGLGTWIVKFQPFAVPAVTNTDQPFQNSTLSISLRYPQGWAAHIDQKNGSVSFYDSSHTGQVIVLAPDANGTIDQYIKKEAVQLGMTGQTNQPSLTFAGASWQQIKGSVVQNGATYTTTLLVMEHNNRFYSIVQLAPPAAYNGEEQLVFSDIRSSFRFLS